MNTTQDKGAPKWQLGLLVMLYLLVIIVAVLVVMKRHESRALFVESQKLQKQHDILLAEWSRLKLEQGVVLNEIYVERKAREELGMKIPDAKDIRIVREE